MLMIIFKDLLEAAPPKYPQGIIGNFEFFTSMGYNKLILSRWGAPQTPPATSPA